MIQRKDWYNKRRFCVICGIHIALLTLKGYRMASRLNCALFISLIVTYWSQIFAQDSVIRVNSDYDESSCLCGLNSKILDQLEVIVRISTPTCAINQVSNEVSALDLDPTTSSHLRPQEITENTLIKDDLTTATSPQNVTKEDDQPVVENPILMDKYPEQQVTKVPVASNEQAIVKNDDKHDNANNGKTSSANATSGSSGSGSSSISSSSISSSSSSVSITTIEKLTIEIQRLEQQIKHLQQVSLGSETSSSTVSSTAPIVQEEKSNEALPQADKPGRLQVQVVDAGFLNGLVDNPKSPYIEALMKLNQSKHIEPQEMENALQSTVPNVVSNIFSNIQNLSIQTEQQPAGKQPTSGDFVVKGNTTAEITESGEMIFLAWIEHQIETLHLTASMANYIRKSSLNLFKKIVKQYVNRVSKIGDSLEDNMRRATQMALNNTQGLIGFLLKNYINFAGGLMQIIGDQVSRVGKQLDSTGDSIAHTSMNPFDMVSNVIESLPNPSDYSKYFREFGKQLMGQTTNQQQESSNSQDSNQNGADNAAQKSHGLISKTMGALSKTLGSWLG